MTLVQSQRKENQIISEYKQGEIYKWHFLFQLPLNLGCRRMKSEPLFPGGLGTTCPQGGFGILSHSLPLGFSGSWNAAGECSSATTCLNSSYKGKIGSTVLEKGSLAHLREGWREKEFICFFFKICSSFEAFSKCNWTSAAPSVAAVGDFTRRELNTFMQDPPIST